MGLADERGAGSASRVPRPPSSEDRAGAGPSSSPARPDRSPEEPSRNGPLTAASAAAGSAAAGSAAAAAAPMAVDGVSQSNPIPADEAASSPAASHSAPNTSQAGSSPPSPSPPPTPTDYLAAGVLPFCVLGGDLLFLLGQQLRFRSRTRGSSFSKTRGPATSAGGIPKAGVEDRGTREAPATSPIFATPPVPRPRRGPRLKLSIPSSTPCVPSTSEPPASTRASLCGQAAPTPGNEPEEVPEEGASKTSAQPESTKKVPPASAGVRGPAAAADNATVAAAAAAAHCEDCDASSSPKGPDDQPNLQGEVEGSDEPPAAAEAATGAAAAAATAAKEDAAAQSTRWGEEQGDSPGQGTVPAGLLWSDFGGGREEGEDAEETASREFAEESFGMFDGVRLDSDSVARSQASMSSALRDPSLRGKRVFESRNGGYVMFIAEVDFVPDMMMNLARKAILDGASSDGRGTAAAAGDATHEGGARGRDVASSSPGFSEKTDFAWVPASVLLAAMRESRNRSTRKVVVKLGGCRYLRLFHKFVISLWGLDLAAVIKAASAPLHLRRSSTPLPRVLLLKPPETGDRSRGEPSGKKQGAAQRREGGRGGSAATAAAAAAIRGIDCVRPTFLSGRKRTSLGIIEERRDHGGAPARGGSGGSCGGAGSQGGKAAAAGGKAAASGGSGRGESAAPARDGGDGGDDAPRKARSKRSGAACRKRRRQCKKARGLKAAAVAAAAASSSTSAAVPGTGAEEALPPTGPGDGAGPLRPPRSGGV